MTVDTHIFTNTNIGKCNFLTDLKLSFIPGETPTMEANSLGIRLNFTFDHILIFLLMKCRFIITMDAYCLCKSRMIPIKHNKKKKALTKVVKRSMFLNYCCMSLI